MNPIENQLTIPPAILALKDGTASEKMLLALYTIQSRAINFVAMRTLGVGLSGLKKIKSRLIAKRYLRVTASGYEVLVPGLASEPEPVGGHFVSNSSGLKNRDKVATADSFSV